MSIIRFSHTAAMLVVAAGLASFAVPALAEQHVLSGTHSKEDVKKACDGVGGITNEGAGGTGYGCYNPKNGVLVACNNGGICTGYTPGRIVPGSLRHLLNLAAPTGVTQSFTPDPSPAGTGNGQGGAAPVGKGGVRAGDGSVVIY